jgi:diguanylate cyclase (GGDEF)-like protein
MLASVRIYDAVGRYGGEEFLIILPGCDASSTRENAERIRAALEGPAIEMPEGSVRVTLSIGALSTDA